MTRPDAKKPSLMDFQETFRALSDLDLERWQRETRAALDGLEPLCDRPRLPRFSSFSARKPLVKNRP